ncbi:hypothetical protein [Nocardioides sp. KR10-350]|uniref:hypothetical protein n=1 Tax=Nocardioides cheoyonin TaxID=3156615 RepID=UPI0032B56D4F
MSRLPDPHDLVDPDVYDAWEQRQLAAAPPMSQRQREDIAKILAGIEARLVAKQAEASADHRGAARLGDAGSEQP